MSVLVGLLSCGSLIADEGMWLVNQPPTQMLKDRYGFEPAPDWLEHVQKSAARIGASGSFVSAHGLVMTNHHVGSDAIEKLSTPERNLLRDGFVAAKLEDELRCPDSEISVLVSISDVTEKVVSAAPSESSPAEAAQRRRERIAEIEREATRDGLHGDVVTLYHGARYHLYQYKRYTDVRLVMAPEQQIAFFGGDNDNFEYPRYNLDMCFFRVYGDDGKPAEIEHYLKWSTGAKEGDVAIVVGNPGRTNRLYTVDHLKFLRDCEMPFGLAQLWRREVQIATFGARDAEQERMSHEEYLGVQNGRKVRSGHLETLQDPRVFAAKAAAESKLRAFVEADPQRKRQWGTAWDELTAALGGLRGYHVRYQLLSGRGAGGGSDLFRIARSIVRLADELPKENTKRLPEYRDKELPRFYRRLYSPSPIYPALETEQLASFLSNCAEQLGGDNPIVVTMLAGKPPYERARELVAGTKLADIDVRKSLAEGGGAALAKCDDSLIRLVAAIDEASRALRKRYEDEYESIERMSYAKIAAAQFAMLGESTPPDATGTLRLAFGPIKGYEEDGKAIPAFTDFAGLYERQKQRGGMPPFDLPHRWTDRKLRLALDTPFNFVCTADIIGGNSGSPVLNRAGEVIGLIFDGNIHSLGTATIYSDEKSRAVAVDSRAIIEALRKMYDADRIANELLGR